MMEQMIMILYAVLSNVILGVVLALLIVLDKDGIITALKLRFGKGMVYTIMFGNDKRIYLGAKQFSGKVKDTATTEIDGLPYSMNKQKLWQYNKQPCMIYEEGISEPIGIKAGELQTEGLTPELFKQAIIIARASGKMSGDDKMQKLQFYLTIGACAGACVSAYLVYKLSGSLETLPATLGQIGAVLTEIGKKVLGG